MSDPRIYSDEALSAFLDGELPAEDRRALEAELLQDAALRARLDSFRAVSSLMKEAFDPIAKEPIPAHILDLIGADPRTEDPVKAEPDLERTVLPFKRAWRPLGLAWQAALAASIALVAGGFIGSGLQFWRAGDGSREDFATLDAGWILPGNPLFSALETTPSGERLSLEDGSRLAPILSFVAKDGRHCREFEAFAGDAASVGIACRETGAWRVEILLAAAPSPEGAYVPASGGRKQAFEDVVSDLMSAGTLDRAEEDRLIRNGWK